MVFHSESLMCLFTRKWTSITFVEFDRDHPFKSVLRQTRDFNVTMNFFLDVPDEPAHGEDKNKHYLHTLHRKLFVSDEVWFYQFCYYSKWFLLCFSSINLQDNISIYVFFDKERFTFWFENDRIYWVLRILGKTPYSEYIFYHVYIK